MEHLTKLFSIIELTRDQTQYGYALSGLKRHEQSDLAGHHYLVTFMTWQLGRALKRKGAEINLEKAMEFALLHDLGELFGGDISFHYSRINRRARTRAKAFELENQKFLAKFFGNDQRYVKQLMEEILKAKSDEALLAKIADYIECTQFLKHSERATAKTVKENIDTVSKMTEKFKDEVARTELKIFAKVWTKQFFKEDILDILYETKKTK